MKPKYLKFKWDGSYFPLPRYDGLKPVPVLLNDIKVMKPPIIIGEKNETTCRDPDKTGSV